MSMLFEGDGMMPGHTNAFCADNPESR